MTAQPEEGWVLAEWLAFFSAGYAMFDASLDYVQNPTRRNFAKLVAAIAGFCAAAMAPSVRMAMGNQIATLYTAVTGLEDEHTPRPT